MGNQNGATQRYRDGNHNPSVVVVDGSFHGRTMATLTATGNRKVHAGFEPLSGFVRAPFNDIAAIQAIADNNPGVVAVLVEPILGEGGIHIPDDNYLPALRNICDQQGWLLMLDEVQTVMPAPASTLLISTAVAYPMWLPLRKVWATVCPLVRVYTR